MSSYCTISPTSSAPWPPQAGNDVVDVVDSEHDAADAQRVRRRAFRLGSDRRRRVELRQHLHRTVTASKIERFVKDGYAPIGPEGDR
jgi:hypothetical protein